MRRYILPAQFAPNALARVHATGTLGAAMSRTDRTSSPPATHDGDTRPPAALAQSPQKAAPARPYRRRWPWVLGVIIIVAAAAIAIPWLSAALTTVSTDDAYVNGHV